MYIMRVGIYLLHMESYIAVKYLCVTPQSLKSKFATIILQRITEFSVLFYTQNLLTFGEEIYIFSFGNITVYSDIIGLP